MKKLCVFVSPALVVMALILGSCSKPTDPITDTGRLEIRMIDNPAAYDEVNVVVNSVQVHVADTDTSSGWISVNSTQASYNLLNLVNGVYAIIGDAEVPIGRYSQIRLFIGSGSTVKVDGVTKPLNTPSGAQSGVKLNVDANIQAGITYTLTIDFDAHQSVLETGSPTNPQYILKPVIRVITTATTGIISGSVFPDTVQCAVWAFGNQDTVSTSTDTTGAFSLTSLYPDAYSVQLIPTNISFKDTTISNVTVTAGATTNLGTVSLSEQ